MAIQEALKAFTSVGYHTPLPEGLLTGMQRVLIHDARDFDIGIAKPEQLRTPILTIPVGAEGVSARDVELLATAAQDICNFGASRRDDAVDASYQGQPIDQAVATLTDQGLCVSPHEKSGKDGTFLHVSYDGFVDGADLHLQMMFDT